MTILIAVLHALPIIGVAFLSGTQPAVYTTTGIMLLIAVFTGEQGYFFIDAIAIATGTITALYLIRQVD